VLRKIEAKNTNPFEERRENLEDVCTRRFFFRSESPLPGPYVPYPYALQLYPVPLQKRARSTCPYPTIIIRL
jgi:hypothetical protein